VDKQEILDHLDKRAFYAAELPSLKVNGSNTATALCPFHGDTKPSLSIDLKTGGFKCFGCDAKGSIFDFHARCHGGDFKSAVAALAQKAGLTTARNKIVATYDYTDEAGKLLFQVARYEPKGFAQRRPDGKDGWIYNLKDVRLVPYNLPAVLAIDSLAIVEGERDVKTIEDLGITGSCNAMGAGKWRPEFNKFFQGKEVVVIPDNDDPGAAHAVNVARNLYGVANYVKIVNLPGLPAKGDVTDWVSQGGTTDALLKLIENTPEWKPETTEESTHQLTAISVRDFLALTLPPRKVLLSPWLPSQGLCMVYGYRGLGKTYFLLGVAIALSSGGNFLKWTAPEPKRVLYLDGEMPATTMQERLANVIRGSEHEPLDDHLHIITPDLQPSGMPDLSTIEGQSIVQPFAESADVVILDNISTLCRTGAENKGEDWSPVQAWALSLRRKGVSVVLTHHAGKGGLQRGTSRREDVLDTVINLKRPAEYSPSEGLRAEIHFEKARGIFGDDVRPFETRLITDARGSRWEVKDLEQSFTERVAELLKEGMSQTEIADMLKIAKGTVSKHKKKAQDMGLWP